MHKDRKASEYTADIRAALMANAHAVEFYFPPDAERRKVGSLRLALEFGYGLADFEDGEAEIGATYSQLYVAFCFDRTGVQVDAKEWVTAIQEGIAKSRAYESPV